jgi:hypothetical protein
MKLKRFRLREALQANENLNKTLLQVIKEHRPHGDGLKRAAKRHLAKLAKKR